MSTLTATRTLVSFALIACGATACGVITGHADPESTDPAEASATSVESETGEAPLAASTADVCWKRTTVRGVGTIPSECPGGEKNGLLCYPRCRNGFAGAGPVCWQRCPEGYQDDGALCRRDAHITSADSSACPWYDKCGLTLAKGCSKCPQGYANDGCTCRRDAHIFAKTTETRGAGTPMSCPAGTVNDAGLCYKPCDPQASGVGPVCWVRCGGEMPIECGAGCARTQEACSKAISDQVLKTTEVVVKAVEQEWSAAIASGIEAANSFHLPLCGAR